ncbi:MAG TPA: NAD(P)H-dependent oxidoreductase [Rhodanobacteraceae bacterium]|nr:NAD(P)H-dependent oxidoreductase [Rhodanobacteraceae bacterium]
MQATILLGTLKRSGLSNTQTLCEFLAGRMERSGIGCEIVKLVDHDIAPGTCSDIGGGDAWPAILRKLLASEIVVFATPVWWGNQSSEIQRAIERLDELHDEVLAGKPSRLEGKAGGIVVTGDSDGAEHIIGNLCNFFNAVGLLVPPYATLSVLWDKQAKGRDTPKEELLLKYESDYAGTTDKMIRQLLKYVRAPEDPGRNAT